MMKAKLLGAAIRGNCEVATQGKMRRCGSTETKNFIKKKEEEKGG